MQGPNKNLGLLLIEIDKTAYYPGEQIKGKIYLQVNSQYVEGEQLFLKIEGSEFVESQKQNSKLLNQGRDIIYDYESLIHDFRKTYLPPGQLDFPFEIHLDTNIPGSMELNDQQNKFSCKIQYKLIAVIRNYNNETCLRKEEAFIIKERMNENGQQSRQTIQPEIKEWCFLNKGHTIFTAFMETNSFLAGKTCLIQIYLNNANCYKVVRYIYVKLINNITIRFDNGQEKQIKRLIFQQQQPGMAASTNQNQPKIFELPIKDPTQNQLYGTVNEASIEIKINCFDLFTPAVELPITIVTQETEKKFKLPPDWLPSKLENNVIKIERYEENTIKENKVDNKNIAKVNPENFNIQSTEIMDQDIQKMLSSIVKQSAKQKNTGDVNK